MKVSLIEIQGDIHLLKQGKGPMKKNKDNTRERFQTF